MEKKQKTMGLAAKLIVGFTFLGVFILNVFLFVKKDGSGFSVESLKAYAQTGGSNNEEERGDSMYEARVEEVNVSYEDCLYQDIIGGTVYWVKGKRTVTHKIVTCIGDGTVSCISEQQITSTPCGPG
jgi:hypothetical protein